MVELAIDASKRCPVCGRPKPGSGEPLLPREIECQGCCDEYEALKAEYPDAEAKGKAWQNHVSREEAAYKAKILLIFERNAAGLDGGTGLPLDEVKLAALVDPDLGRAITLEEVKARAADVVAQLKRGG